MRSASYVPTLLVWASVTAFAPEGALAQSGATALDGRALAAELGCGGCHTGMPAPDPVRERVPRLGPEGTPLPPQFVFEYLADPVKRRDDIGLTRMPDFRLDEGERVALALFLGTGAVAGALEQAVTRHPEADSALGRRIFGALGCAGCHTGVTEAQARGPDLSREGVRVRASWLRSFLQAPLAVRAEGDPGLGGARMPDFGLTPAEAEALTTFLSGLGAPLDSLAPEPMTAFETRRTRTLIEERLACLGCHSLDGEGGHIGPTLNGVRSRLKPGFVLEMITAPQRAAPGSSMPRQRMPRSEAVRVARYLLADGDAGGSSTAAASEAGPDRTSLADPGHRAWYSGVGAESSDGPALYRRHCAACHGSDGDGDGWNAPYLPVPPTAHSDSTLMSRRPDDTLFDGVHAGAWVLDGSPRMPPFGELLTTGQIRALVGYIRELCSCRQPDWAGHDPAGRP